MLASKQLQTAETPRRYFPQCSATHLQNLLPSRNATAATLLRIPNCFSFIIDQNGPRGQATQTYFLLFFGDFCSPYPEPPWRGCRNRSGMVTVTWNPGLKDQTFSRVENCKRVMLYTPKFCRYRYKFNMCIYIYRYIYIYTHMCIILCVYIYSKDISYVTYCKSAHCSVLAKPSSAQRLPCSFGSLGIEDQLVETSFPKMVEKKKKKTSLRIIGM